MVVMKCIATIFSICVLLGTTNGKFVYNLPVTGNDRIDPHNNTVPYRWMQLKIENIGSSSKFVHYHLPSPDLMYFTSVFEKNFLHQVLDLIEWIKLLKYSFAGQTIGWSDVCYHHKFDKNCLMNSILQYYNQSHDVIDRVLRDKYGFFVVWAYLDHFLACTSNLMMQYDTKLNASCTDINGRPILPQSVLSGYDDVNFNNATSLVITMLFSTEHTYPDAVTQWQNEMTKLIHNYNNPNMTITIVRPKFPYWPPFHKDSLNKIFLNLNAANLKP